MKTKKAKSQDVQLGILKTDIFGWKIKQRVSAPQISTIGVR